MKPINNNYVEVLPSLLDKSKVQTIRKAWNNPAQIKMPEGFTGGVDWSKEFLEKPAEYKVGDKVPIVWKEDFPEEQFCKITGHPIMGNCNQNLCNLHVLEDVDCPIFYKNLGVVEITEVFKVEMHKKKVDRGYAWIFHPIGEDWLFSKRQKIWKQDGFKSAEDMFKAIDKIYDLSSPKEFHVYRWRWL